jgi:hypothetical protein
MMVVHIEPPLFPVLVGVDELVRQVLSNDIFTHLDSDTANYSQVIRAGLGLQPEEFLKHYPVQLDPHKGLTKMDEDRGVEDTIWIHMNVLDAIIVE